MADDRTAAIKDWTRLDAKQQQAIREAEEHEFAARHREHEAKRSRRVLLLHLQRLQHRRRSTSDEQMVGIIEERIARARSLLAVWRKRDMKANIVAPNYVRAADVAVRGLIDWRTHYQAFLDLIEQAQSSPCLNPSVQVFIIKPAEFHEYRWAEEVNYSKRWGPNDVGATWYAFPGTVNRAPTATELDACQWINFNVFAMCSSSPWSLFDETNIVASAGVLKFVLPPQPCRSRVQWAIVPIIDLVMGATIEGDYGALSLDYVFRQQPGTTAFSPDASFEEDFSWVETSPRIWYSANDIGGWSWQRNTQQRLITGSYDVAPGTPSSVLAGVSGLAFIEDGKTCIGDCSDNSNLDGRLKFAQPFCGIEPDSPMASMCEVRPQMTFVVTPY